MSSNRMLDPRAREVLDVLTEYLGSTMSSPILRLCATRARVNLQRMKPADGPRLVRELDLGVQSYVNNDTTRQRCREKLESILVSREAEPRDLDVTSQIPIQGESDIVSARGTGRDLCRELGFPTVVQIKVATAISELARNIVQYVGEGTIEISGVAEPRVGIKVIARDSGDGIPNIDEILSGHYSSRSGMGMGILGTKKLMDDFLIESSPESGTRVEVAKYLS